MIICLFLGGIFFIFNNSSLEIKIVILFNYYIKKSKLFFMLNLDNKIIKSFIIIKNQKFRIIIEDIINTF